MTKISTPVLSDAEIKAELLDASPELLAACLKRLDPTKDNATLYKLLEIIERKLAILPVYQTGVDYRIEEFHDDMTDEFESEVPCLTEDDAYAALKPVLGTYDMPDAVYSDIADLCTETLTALHKQKFSEWWAEQEAEKPTTKQGHDD